jgi:predicted  nucleic acid-binding Zn-ribbon protein
MCRPFGEGGIRAARTLTRPSGIALLAAVFFLSFILNATPISAQEDTSPPPAPATPKTPQEEELDREIRILKLKKERDELKKDIRNAQPTPSVTPLEGKTTLDDKVTIEAEIVSYKAMSDAMYRVGNEIHSYFPNAKTIAIYSESDVKDWRFYQAMFPAFKFQLEDINKEYADLLSKRLSVTRQPGQTESATMTELFGIGMAQDALFAGSSLTKSFIDFISLFRTDTVISGVPVTIESTALVAEVFRALSDSYNNEITLYHPAVMSPRPDDSSPTLDLIKSSYLNKAKADKVINDFEQQSKKIKEYGAKIEGLAADISKNEETIKDSQESVTENDQQIRRLRMRLNRARREADRRKIKEQIHALEADKVSLLEKKAELEKENSDKAAKKAVLEAELRHMEALANAAKDVVPKLKAVNERFEHFIDEFVKIDDKTGVNALALFVKSESLDKALEAKESYWLEIKAVKAGGNNRTRKNLVRYLSGSKVDHSGGVIIEYTLYNKNGAAVLADKYSRYQWYIEPKKISNESEVAENQRAPGRPVGRTAPAASPQGQKAKAGQ